jgi:hypothetical protein
LVTFAFGEYTPHLKIKYRFANEIMKWAGLHLQAHGWKNSWTTIGSPHRLVEYPTKSFSP